MTAEGAAGRSVRIGVVGLGFMGATHIRCIQSSGAGATLAGVCDPDPERRKGLVAAAGNLATVAASERLFDPSLVPAYASPDELLADPDVDAVSICTPTDTHADLAIRAMRAGRHVLIEKPVAVASADVQRVIDAAEELNVLCAPGMCMRFWPGWPFVREKIRAGEFGRVVSAAFQRLGSPPPWSPEFYRNPERSGGAMVDLHIHDADFIRWCFGDPESVTSTGSSNHLTTLYRYPPGRGPEHVVAEGGWGHSPGFDFRMRYVIAFERATVDFDLTRKPTVRVYREGRVEVPELSPLSAYQLQMDSFVRAVRDRLAGAQAGGTGAATTGAPLVSTLEDALGAARLLEAERESLRTRCEVKVAAAPRP